MKRIYFLFLFITLFISNSFGQRWGEHELGKHNWGIHFGITSELGTHVKNFGFKVQAYYNYEFVQINVGNHLRFNMQNIGGRENFIEDRISFGGALLGGRRNIIPQFIMDGLNHQTSYEFGLAYNYLYYFDNIGTSQRSGGFGLHINQFSVLMENDLFAGLGRDRFRTSYFGISYHNEFYNIAINTRLWTGDTRNTRMLNTSDSTYQIGYKDLSDNLFGKFSHGIISASLDYAIFYGNSLSVEAGLDSEHVRNFLQNKLIHDKKFVPKKIRKPNPNYPMLNREGYPIHDREEVAPPRILFGIGLNRSLTY